MKHNKWFIVGGAGGIGSHFIDKLLYDPSTTKLTIYDNFSSGREWHYENHIRDLRFEVIRGNVEDTVKLTEAMRDHDVVIHLASNPDIAKAATQPDIDFWQGTVLTNSVLEAMRISGVNRLLYASGSGVYGDIGEEEAQEDRGKLLPISTYGASKLAGEVLINSYCYMFGLSACAFRFGNVAANRATHGVYLDFIRQLINNPSELFILGNGLQSKSYVAASDIISAVLLANKKLDKSFEIYNVATKNYLTVNEIADMAVECLNLKSVKYKYSGGDRGWKADIPIVRMNSDKIRSLGWNNLLSSKEAIKLSIINIINNIKNSKIK